MTNAWVVGLFLAAVVVVCGVAGIGWVLGRDEPREKAPPAEVVSAGERAYLDALGAIDPGLVTNEARALRRAEETCADIAAGLDGEALTARVVARLSGGDAQIDSGQADRAVGLMRQHICR